MNNSDKSFAIGTWHERESREITAHTGYAADYINHQTVAADYTAHLIVVAGYTIPMPQWVIVKLATNITDGVYFSGIGGSNFAQRKVEPGPSTKTLQMYDYHIPQMVASGRLTLFPEWEFLNADKKDVIKHIAQHGLPEVKPCNA